MSRGDLMNDSVNNEGLIREFLKDNGRSTYPNFKLEDVWSIGSCVTCRECSECGHYFEQHMIEMLDLLTWVYNKRGESE
jgi:hypothetical protein